MSAVAIYLAQWAVLASIAGVAIVIVHRTRARIADLERDAWRKRRHLWSACVHLRTARGRGQRLDPFVDQLVDETLAWCPESASGAHAMTEPGRGCLRCGIILRE